MKLINTSRRFYKFEYDSKVKVNFDFDDIRTDEEGIWFQRPVDYESHRVVFDTPELCKAWQLKFEAAMEGFVANKRIDKALPDVKSDAIKMTDSEWGLVSKYMTNPDRFDKDNDIKIFESHLANNFRDRDGERFSKQVLKSFEKTMVGKGKLNGHDWRGPGDGRFYKAKLVPMTVDQVIEMVGAHPDKKFKDHLAKVEEIDGAIYWLVTRYYMPNITETQKEAVINIESGIWKDMSIGFRAPKKFAIFADGKESEVGTDEFYDMRKNKDNPLLFLEFRNDKETESEALEGSHVFLGSQYGAQTTKSFEDLEKKVDTLLAKLIGKIEEPEIVESIQDKQDDWIKIDTITDEEIKFYVAEIDRLIPAELHGKAVWTAAQINEFEDNCFAYCENTGDKDDKGQTMPKNARHLPHHPQGKGATGTGGEVDLPHLRNALARVNQVKPVTDSISAEELQSKSKSHLIAHAKKLGVGDYESLDKSINQHGDSDMVFENEKLGVKVTVKADSFEDDLAKLTEAIDKGFAEKVEALNAEHAKAVDELNQKLVDQETANNELQDKYDAQVDEFNKRFEKAEALEKTIAGFKEVWGENPDVEIMKKAKETEAAFREAEINRALKFGKLSGLVDDAEAEKKLYVDEKVERVSALADKYFNVFVKRNPQLEGVFKASDEGLDPDPQKPKRELKGPANAFIQ